MSAPCRDGSGRPDVEVGPAQQVATPAAVLREALTEVGWPGGVSPPGHPTAGAPQPPPGNPGLKTLLVVGLVVVLSRPTVSVMVWSRVNPVPGGTSWATMTPD
jgi:hypothetical protein